MNPDLIRNILELIGKFTGAVCIYNVSMTALSKVKLKREKQYEQYLIREFPYVDPIPLEERKKRVNSEKNKELLFYIENLERFTDEENLKTAYRNLSTVDVKWQPYKIIYGTLGSYDAKKNQLKYALNDTLGYDFLNMCSTYYDVDSNEKQSGFSWQKGFSLIGKGLNVGYTELLNARIYNEDLIEGHEKEARLAELIEFFFDDPKEMESLYFNHDLVGFIKHMEQFQDRDEVIKLIREMDQITFLSRLGNPLPTYEYIKIQLKLYDWFKEKNNDPEKLEEMEDFLNEDKMVSIALKRQKTKLVKGFPKRVHPVFKGKKQEKNKQEDLDMIPFNLYQRKPFKELCSELFQVSEDEINILQATKLYCLMTNIDFTNCDRKTRNTIARQVQTLILPEEEKTSLEQRMCNQLQKKLDSIWYNTTEELEKINTTKRIG